MTEATGSIEPTDAGVPGHGWLRRTFHRSLLARLLVLGGVLAVVAATVVIVAVGWWWRSAPVSNVGALDFANPVHIPRLDEGALDADGTRVFRLEPQHRRAEVVTGTETETLSFDGDGPFGPTLRARRGEAVRVEVANTLAEPTTVHWHGMRLPARADGGPHQAVEPGGTWTPEWQVDQPAATLWYHPHLHGRTEDQVRRGLAGFFLLDEADGPDERLPSTYGVDDVPLAISDQAFDEGGRLVARRPLFASSGHLGDEILVNGTHDPHLAVTTERIRLRLLNAATARVLGIELSDGRSFTLIGTDGGLLGEPVELDHLRLSPGERAEIVVEVAPGERVVLRSDRPDLAVNPFTHRAEGGDDRFDLIELRAATELAPSPVVPSRLAGTPVIDPGESVRTRSFDLSGTRINGRRMDLARVDATVRAGSVEIWEVEAGGQVHNFHIHDVQFLILDREGRPPPPELRGWKDTVYLGGAGRVRLIVRFGEHADPTSAYMFHCHLLRHEDDGMMGQFVVTEDGVPVQEVPVAPAVRMHHHGS